MKRFAPLIACVLVAAPLGRVSAQEVSPAVQAVPAAQNLQIVSQPSSWVLAALQPLPLDEALEVQEAQQRAALDAPATPQKGITEITLQHLPGFVRPPAQVYKITFYSDGRATALKGKSGNNKEYTGFIGERDFKHLAEFVEQIKFFDLEPLYTTGVTDQATVVTSVVKDGQRKEVRDYAYQGPTNLWSLEKVLRGLDAEMNWKEVPPKEAPTKEAPPTTAPATNPAER